MIVILVISQDRGFNEAIREELSDHSCKLSCQPTFAEAQPVLASNIFDFCIIDAGSSLRHSVHQFESLQHKAGGCKFIAVAQARYEDIEYACQQGLLCVLPKPLQVRLLKILLSEPVHQNDLMTRPPPPSAVEENRSSRTANFDIIRSVSRFSSHSLDLPSLVQHFTLKVREIVGVNRIAIFLEDQKSGLPSRQMLSHRRLRHICSIGIPADVQSCLELSKNNGIGHWVTRTGQILRAEQAGALLSPSEVSRVQHEFNILGCQVAIPIADRERTIGVALLGGHLTRTSFSDEEFQMMFHMMEELGLSIKNNRLQSELAANHRLFDDVLTTMKSGILVVGPELEIIHANPAMVAFIGGNASSTAPLAFADLPATIAERIHEVVELGNRCDPFFFREESSESRTFRVSIILFQNLSHRPPQSAMVVMEDFTEVENAREVTVEAADQKLTNLIAKRFAHEIRKSLVPLTTHLQAIDDRCQEPDFQASLKGALASETTRISRFTDQMLLLAESPPPPSILTGVEKLLRESFAKAQNILRTEGILTVQNRSNRSNIQCHPPNVIQAFQEIFMNGLQSHPFPQIVVTIEPAPNDKDSFLRIGFRDNGDGFNEEAAGRGVEPFYTSRDANIGLGLTIANRVAQDHGGWLKIYPRSSQDHPDLLMYFPTRDRHN